MNRQHHASFSSFEVPKLFEWLFYHFRGVCFKQKEEKKGKRVEFVTWSWILLCAMNLSCGMSHFSMNVYENVSYHASCHFSILPHIWRTGFHTRTLHALQRSASVVSIIHVYIITIATCHSYETLHGCQKQQFWFASQVITSLILHIAKTVSKIKKLRTVAQKFALFADVGLPPHCIGCHDVFTGDGIKSRETEMTGRD